MKTQECIKVLMRIYLVTAILFSSGAAFADDASSGYSATDADSQQSGQTGGAAESAGAGAENYEFYLPPPPSDGSNSYYVVNERGVIYDRRGQTSDKTPCAQRASKIPLPAAPPTMSYYDRNGNYHSPDHMVLQLGFWRDPVHWVPVTDSDHWH